MRHRWLLIGLFLLATVLVDLAALSAWSGPCDEWVAFPVVALALAQTQLMAIWLVLGRTPGPFRLLIAVAVILAWSTVLLTVQGWSPYTTVFLGVVLVPTLPTSASLELARMGGLGLIDLSLGDHPGGRHPFQFTLLQMFEWTTSVAVILGISMYLSNAAAIGDVVHGMQSVWWLLSCWSLAAAAMTWAALWAVLGMRRSVPRMIAAGVIAAAAVGAGAIATTPNIVLINAFALVGSLAVFRVAGYRVGRRNRPATVS